MPAGNLTSLNTRAFPDAMAPDPVEPPDTTGQ